MSNQFDYVVAVFVIILITSLMLLTFGNDIEVLYDMYTEPYDMDHYPSSYEQGMLGYGGPTVIHYPDGPEINWDYWINWKINKLYMYFGYMPPGSEGVRVKDLELLRRNNGRN